MLLLGTVLAGAPSAPRPGIDWPQFRGISAGGKYEQRLAGATSAFTSSPIASDGKVYIASEDGQVFVLKAGPAYEVIAMNEMATPVLATPAISGGRLLLRTQDLIMAIGKK